MASSSVNNNGAGAGGAYISRTSSIIAHDMTPIDPLVLRAESRSRTFSSPAAIVTTDGRTIFPLRQINDPQKDAIKASFASHVDPRPFTSYSGPKNSTSYEASILSSASADRPATRFQHNRFNRDSLGVSQNMDGSGRIHSASTASSRSRYTTTTSTDINTIKALMGVNAILVGTSTDVQREKLKALLDGSSPDTRMSVQSQISGPTLTEDEIHQKRSQQRDNAAFYDEQMKNRQEYLDREKQNSVKQARDSEMGPNGFMKGVGVKRIPNAKVRSFTSGSHSPLTKQDYEKREKERKELEQMITDNDEHRKEARVQRIEEEKKVLEHANKLDQDARDPAKKRTNFNYNSTLSNDKKYDPKEQGAYHAILARQLEERERKDAMDRADNRKPNDSIVNMLGRPGHGAPITGDLHGEGQQEGSLVTHLHHLGSGNDAIEMQKYQNTFENRSKLRTILDRHQKYRQDHPEESTNNPSKLPQSLKNPEDPAEYFDPDVKNNARVYSDLTRGPGHILNNIHERKTNNYFEFGLPGGGAPRLRATGVSEHEATSSNSANYEDIVETTLPARDDGKTASSKESTRAYALTLDQARQQKQEIMARLARDEQEEQSKLDREKYNPFGRPGAGAPLDPKSKKAAIEAQKMQDNATVDPKNAFSVAQIWSLGDKSHKMSATHATTDILQPIMARLSHPDASEVSSYKMDLDSQITDRQSEQRREKDQESKKSYLGLGLSHADHPKGYAARMAQNRQRKIQEKQNLANQPNLGNSLPLPFDSRKNLGASSSSSNNHNHNGDGMSSSSAAAAANEDSGRFRMKALISEAREETMPSRQSQSIFPWDKLGKDQKHLPPEKRTK